MLTSVATLIALLILEALTIVWGRRQQAAAKKYQREAENARAMWTRAADHSRQWREEAIRLRAIVDRVEEGRYGPRGSAS